MQSELSAIILTLRISAKFLGLIESLPFNCQPDSLSAAILSSQLEFRDKVNVCS